MQDGRNPEVSSGRQAEERGEHELEGEVGREEGERAVLEGEQGEVARRERGREKERGGRREREGGVVEVEKRKVWRCSIRWNYMFISLLIIKFLHRRPLKVTFRIHELCI